MKMHICVICVIVMMSKKFKRLKSSCQSQTISIGVKKYLLKKIREKPCYEMLNKFERIHSIPEQSFQPILETDRLLQTDFHTTFDFARLNPIKYNVLEKFVDSALNSKANLVNSDMNVALENPYKDSLRQNSSNFNSEQEFANILSVLKSLKSVYLVKSSNSKEQNASRMKKFNILNNFFLKPKDGNEWYLDSAGYLVFNNLHTGVKFSRYIDYFMKYPNDVSKTTPMPIYFEELFLNKILHQKDLSPLVEIEANNQENHVKSSNTSPRFQQQILALKKIVSIKRRQIRKQNQNFQLLKNLQNDEDNNRQSISARTRNALKTGQSFKKPIRKQRESWLKIAKNLKDIENDQSMSDTLSKKLNISKREFAESNKSISRNELVELSKIAKTLDQKLAQMENSFIKKSSKFIDLKTSQQ